MTSLGREFKTHHLDKLKRRANAHPTCSGPVRQDMLLVWLLADDFYEDAVGEGGVAEDVDYAVFGEAAEHGIGFAVCG
jgi:hypothetical protein